jgi:hypothetical protein
MGSLQTSLNDLYSKSLTVPFCLLTQFAKSRSSGPINLLRLSFILPNPASCKTQSFWEIMTFGPLLLCKPPDLLLLKKPQYSIFEHYIYICRRHPATNILSVD